jgi:hypothetical protein
MILIVDFVLLLYYLGFARSTSGLFLGVKRELEGDKVFMELKGDKGR